MLGIKTVAWQSHRFKIQAYPASFTYAYILYTNASGLRLVQRLGISAYSLYHYVNLDRNQSDMTTAADTLAISWSPLMTGEVLRDHHDVVRRA